MLNGVGYHRGVLVSVMVVICCVSCPTNYLKTIQAKRRHPSSACLLCRPSGPGLHPKPLYNLMRRRCGECWKCPSFVLWKLTCAERRNVKVEKCQLGIVGCMGRKECHRADVPVATC